VVGDSERGHRQAGGLLCFKKYMNEKIQDKIDIAKGVGTLAIALVVLIGVPVFVVYTYVWKYHEGYNLGYDKGFAAGIKFSEESGSEYKKQSGGNDLYLNEFIRFLHDTGSNASQ